MEAPAPVGMEAPKTRGLMTQINTRIDAATKRKADAAFTHAGIAPSEAIRALYARAAALGPSLTSVGDLVCDADEHERAHHERQAAFERASRAFNDTLTRLGLSVDVASFAPMTEDEVEEALYQDYLAGGAL